MVAGLKPRRLAARQARLGPCRSADAARRDYLQRGDPVAARDALERALVIAPDYREAQELLQTAADAPALNYDCARAPNRFPLHVCAAAIVRSRGATDRWTVRVSRRARRLSVRVYPGGRVEVVVPPGASAATVQRFVGAHRQWIDRRIEDLSTAAARSTTAAPASINLPAIGRQFTVDYDRADCDRARA